MHELDASTIIFGLLAIFVVWKLRSVLGTRVGIERKRDNVQPLRPVPADGAMREATAGASAATTPAPHVQPAEVVAPTLPATRGLDEIRRADRSFDVESFLGGAQGAYRMIIEAFSRGDRGQLERLLGDEALRDLHCCARRAGAHATPHADPGRRHREGAGHERDAEGLDRVGDAAVQGPRGGDAHCWRRRAGRADDRGQRSLDLRPRRSQQRPELEARRHLDR